MYEAGVGKYKVKALPCFHITERTLVTHLATLTLSFFIPKVGIKYLQHGMENINFILVSSPMHPCTHTPH